MIDLDTIGAFTITPNNEFCKDCSNKDLELEVSEWEDGWGNLTRHYYLECKHDCACMNAYKQAIKEAQHNENS